MLRLGDAICTAVRGHGALKHGNHRTGWAIRLEAVGRILAHTSQATVRLVLSRVSKNDVRSVPQRHRGAKSRWRKPRGSMSQQSGAKSARTGREAIAGCKLGDRAWCQR